MSERWQPIQDFEDFYSVSDLARVLAHERWIARVNGGYWRPQQFLVPIVGTDSGHLYVTLYDAHGRRCKRWVHRLVAIAFIPNPTALPFVLHGPAGASDNRSSQLRWGTRSENERDKRRHRIANQHNI